MEFVSFDDALKRLGITPERLNQLREDNELRAYRDGASWKFRADEIDKMSSEGIPDVPPPSDVGLPSLEELVDARDLGDLGAGDEQSELEIELELDPLDDTVTAGPNEAVSGSDEPTDPSDSILLSDETLGADIMPASPSTIIGRSELEAQDADLELVTEDEGSDLKLSAGASNVLTGGVAGSGVLDEIAKESSHKRAFENLEELEIDLAAESGRVLNPEGAAELRERVADEKSKKGPPDSDLSLSDLGLAGDDEGTDPVPSDLESKTGSAKKDSGPTSDLELATDEDDYVLAEAGGSDITLDSADSGINLIDPSDSGLALDDIPLEAGGSAILESLSKGPKSEPESDISLIGGDSGIGIEEPVSGIQTDNDFRLTPLGEGEDEGDSSSQVIALDGGLEDLGGAEMLDEGAFTEAGAGDMEGEFQADEFAPAGYGAVVARPESDYSIWNVVGLGCVMFLLLFAVMITMDLIRNMWSWDQNLALNDSLLEGILGLFGLR